MLYDNLNSSLTDSYLISTISAQDEVECRIRLSMKRKPSDKHLGFAVIHLDLTCSFLSYWREMKSFFDVKTSWVDSYIECIQSNPDISTIVNILNLLRKNHPHFPPPSDYTTIPRMEATVDTPNSTHREALEYIRTKRLPYHQMIRWACDWNHSYKFFKFEIIVVNPTTITGNKKFNFLKNRTLLSGIRETSIRICVGSFQFE
jgi:hypothetical protein